MISLGSKIALLGVAGTSLIGGITYLLLSNNKESASKDLKKQKIKDLLISKNKSILGKTGNDQKWTKNWNKFKQDYQTKLNRSFWNFLEISNLNAETTVPENFKVKCESSKELDIVPDDKLLEEILLYCTDNGQ